MVSWHNNKRNHIMAKITVTGKFNFFTAKTGTGRDRYCVKVNGIEKNEAGEIVKLDKDHDGYVTVQAWANWDGALPENLAKINGDTTYTVPETGLIRSIDGMFNGEVSFDSSIKAEVVSGRVRQFYQIDLNGDVEAFKMIPTGKKMIKFA